MNWLTVAVTLDAEQLPQAEQLLTELGAGAITLHDALGQTPILEPDPGATPVWPSPRLEALFEADADRSAIALALIAAGLVTSATAIEFAELPEQDWERAWMDRFVPMRFGQNLWICPSHHEPDPAWPVVIRLDPGLAFGSGTHPTTALCLQWLDGEDMSGKTVIDYGAGSGVLAIAAALKGAKRVIAVDHDPQALAACADNARRNGVEDRLEIVAPDALGKVTADVLLANILAGPLIELAERFIELLAPDGRLVLSGILAEQSSAVTAAYRPQIREFAQRGCEHWVCLAGRR